VRDRRRLHDDVRPDADVPVHLVLRRRHLLPVEQQDVPGHDDASAERRGRHGITGAPREARGVPC
jgi:hypothetical protein